ncbi:hypothetical protein [Cellulomonas denverensis]|uniref:Uncharacterized protein n=1 Tax=Cellulomonas denverensis TaxID=264297 RepID=A0A7X6KUE8_9CELL|nr:hypothetical protein [Cellulomonas denverensis]NKY22198.1 hypothetical protein [Cellulomonas denverensis]GIG27161.1 hypothetical protein Cde04nite_34050 [Cellulomonas denverensis]
MARDSGPRIPGEFVPLDVNFAHDRALRASGPAAELLFIRGLAYVKRMRSSGLVPDYDLPVVAVGIPNPAKHASTLVRKGLWEQVDGGWLIRSWSKWNPRSEAQGARQQSRGGSLGNHNRWHTNGRRSDDCEFCPPIATESVTDRSTDRSHRSLRIAEVEEEVEKRERSNSMHSSSPSVGRDEPVDNSGEAASEHTGQVGR